LWDDCQPVWQHKKLSVYGAQPVFFFATNFVLLFINLITNLGFFWGNFCFSSINLTKFSIFFEKIAQIFDITKLQKKTLVFSISY